MWRKRLLPKTFADYSAVILMVSMFPIIYWFEVFMVIPQYFGDRNAIYIFHCIISTYLLINVVGNYVAVYVTDTSIDGKFLSSELKPKWKFCASCDCITPPRSWHCNACNTCILKRDHHCNFTSCCIGHYNQRYFIMFLFYFTLSGIYCTYFNAFYVWKYTSLTLSGFLKLFLPLAALVFGSDAFTLQFYRLLCVFTMVAMVAGSVLFFYHFNNICNGMVMYEKGKNIKDYDLGNAKENIRIVFGNRWYLTWISPFVTSELPTDGIHWDEIKLLTSKGK